MGIRLRRSKDLSGEGNATFFNAFCYEVLLATLILCTLMLVATQSAMSAYAKAEITAAMGRAANHKNAVMIYYSIHGHMPESSKDLEAAGIYEMLGSPDERQDPRYGQIDIEQGALHIQVDHSPDSIISWRPAVLRENPTGSIVWVIGDYFDANRWQAFGVDRTKIPHSEIDTIYYTK